MSVFKIFGVKKLVTAEWSSKVIITLFLISVLFGYAVSLMDVYDKMGTTIQERVLRYRGQEEGEDAASDELYFPMSFSQLVDLTHVHAFSLPMLMFIVGHIFQYLTTSFSQRNKVIVLTVSFAAMLGFMLGPWLIRYVSGVFAWPLMLSNILMGLGLLIMLTVPLYEMWIWPLFRKTPRE